MRRSKAGKSNSVFTGQKPKRHLKKILKHTKAIAVVILAASLCVGSWFVYQYVKVNVIDVFTIATKNPNKDWQVEFLHNHGFNALSTEQKNFVLKNAIKRLTHASSTELESIAVTTQNYLSAKSVNVIRVGVKAVVIAVELYEPFLQITTKATIRYLTEDGDIYGKVSLTPDDTMPLVTGIFDERAAPFTLSKNMTLEQSVEEISLVREAIDLFKQSKQFNYNVQKINYISQRGFVITLADSATTVVLGKAPFNVKLKNLNKILNEYKNNRSQALKIELDYNNKAFVKEDVAGKEEKF